MSVRLRPSAQSKLMPSCVAVARRTLDPLALVRIQARQPKASEMNEWIKDLPRVPESMSRKEGLQEGFELTTLGPDMLIEKLRKVNPGLVELIEGNIAGVLEGVKGKLSPEEINNLKEAILFSHLWILRHLGKVI